MASEEEEPDPPCILVDTSQRKDFEFVGKLETFQKPLYLYRYQSGWIPYQESKKHPSRSKDGSQVGALQHFLPRCQSAIGKRLKGSTMRNMYFLLDHMFQRVQCDGAQDLLELLLAPFKGSGIHYNIMKGKYDRRTGTYGRKDAILKFAESHPFLDRLRTMTGESEAVQYPFTILIDFKRREAIEYDDYEALDEAKQRCAGNMSILWNWHNLDLDGKRYHEYESKTLNRNDLVLFVLEIFYAIDYTSWVEILRNVCHHKSRKRKLEENSCEDLNHRKINLKIGSIIYDFVRRRFCSVDYLRRPLVVRILEPTEIQHTYIIPNQSTKLKYEHILRHADGTILSCSKASIVDGKVVLKSEDAIHLATQAKALLNRDIDRYFS